MRLVTFFAVTVATAFATAIIILEEQDQIVIIQLRPYFLFIDRAGSVTRGPSRTARIVGHVLVFEMIVVVMIVIASIHIGSRSPILWLLRLRLRLLLLLSFTARFGIPFFGFIVGIITSVMMMVTAATFSNAVGRSRTPTTTAITTRLDTACKKGHD